MQDQGFVWLKEWFHSYVGTFYSADRQVQFHIRLKEEHTLRVLENAAQIAVWLNCTAKETQPIKMAALLHDIGRFKQYQLYNTFNDAHSVNHARLGLEVLLDSGCLSAAGLNDKGQDIVKKAILYHNCRRLPPAEEGEAWLIPAQIVRDADKLDIFSMLLTENKEQQIPVPPELSKENTYSLKIIEDILQGNLVEYSDIRTGNDLLLFRLSWIYDIYFACSFSYILKQGYIERLTAFLPGGEERERVQDCLSRHAAQRAASWRF